MQEFLKKRTVLSPRTLRHFAFSRVFFTSESESKTPATSQMKLFVTLANG